MMTKIFGVSVFVMVITCLVLLTQCGKKKDDLANIIDNSDVLHYQDLGVDCDEGTYKA